MRTLTEKYNAVLEGSYNKKQFLRDARLALPNFISQYNGFDDAVSILKNKGMIFEELEKYKADKAPEYDNGVVAADKFNLTDLERGIDYELEKKGFNTVHFDFTEEDHLAAKETAVKNLEKDANYYTNLLAGQPEVTSEKRSDVYKEVEKNNHVDKDNGMVKAKLKESFKKLIVRVLTEDKKKVNEQIKGIVDLSKFEPQVEKLFKDVDPTVKQVDVELSHQEDAELAQAKIMAVPGTMSAEELRDKTIGNPKRFFTDGLRKYFINTLKNVNIEVKDGNLHISFDFYVNPFAGDKGKRFSSAFVAKMRRGDYGSLDEKEMKRKRFNLDGEVI